MDFLNKAYSQIVDLFRSMTPAARLTAGLLVAVIVIGLAFLFRFQTQTADDYLLGGRPFLAGELTNVQRALSQAGLKNWELEGNRIKIPSGQKDVYIAALAENNALPSDWNAAMDKAVDNANPFRSRHEIDLSLARAKQKELGMVISRFRNVEQASVIFDEVEKGGFRRQKLKTASVAVQTNGSGLEEAQVRAIRNLLATSYAGLERTSINITDATTGMSYAPPSENGESGDSLYATNKARYEADFKRKITERLSMVPGVVVGVNVEMDRDLRSDTTLVKIDPKPVPITSAETTMESTSSGPAVLGRPGAVTNGVAGAVGNQPAEVATAPTPGPQSTQNQSTSSQTSVPGYEVSETTKFGHVPQQVTASIDIPTSYYLSIWRENNPTPAGQPEKDPDPTDLRKIEAEQKKRIEDAVVNLLPPPPPGKAPYPLVTVTSYTDIPGPSPVNDSLTTQAGSWFASNWRMLAMLAVGLVGLAMLRGMLRSALPPEPAAPHSAGASHSSHEEEHAEPDPDKPEPILVMRRKLSSKGPNLREELRQLVKDDPDAAANVLRGWIGDAA